MKFKHLEQAQVSASAASRVEFPEIDGCPWLEVRPAGETNRAYMNAALRNVNTQRILRGRVTVEETAKERAVAIPLYAEHVLTGGGGGWIDAESGKEVDMPLSGESRLALLKQLPADLFDRIRVYCNDLGNFRG
jgi:hypothetical protein